VALGTVTPFILGYRVLGGEVVASNAPEFIATTVSRTETFEMTMMSAGKSVTLSVNTSKKDNSIFIIYQFHGSA
jgi:hypothetical protein